MSGPTVGLDEETIAKNKAIWLDQMRELQREVTLDEIAEILSTTIKQDRENKLVTFLCMLLNYTEEDQQNIVFKSESSRGKTYIPTEISAYFPHEDQWKLANCTPRAFYHEYGQYDKETNTIQIDLEKRIIIFQEQRNSYLLQEIRPLLSHDSKVITSKITDRSRRHGHLTKTVCIKGFPTVVFCSAGSKLQEQELTRAFILSPEATKEKLKESIQLLTERLGNRVEFQKWLDEHPKRKWLKGRVSTIKNANVSHIILPDELKLHLREQFLEDRPFLTPRHQRDFKRMIDMVKAHALLNYAQREDIVDGTKKCIVATLKDATEGYKLYKTISESNELGLTPETYEIWRKIIQPEINAGLRKNQIAFLYFQTFHRNLSKYRLDNTINELLACGLIFEDQDEDRRFKIYKPLMIYTKEGGTTPHDDKDTPTRLDVF